MFRFVGNHIGIHYQCPLDITVGKDDLVNGGRVVLGLVWGLVRN